MAKTSKKLVARLKRRVKIRKRNVPERDVPRLSVFRSNRHIYAQIIDDLRNETLAAASTRVKGGKAAALTVDAAKAVGKAVADAAKSKKIDRVWFDRNGYKYHGKVQALADGAREGGLKF